MPENTASSSEPKSTGATSGGPSPSSSTQAEPSQTVTPAAAPAVAAAQTSGMTTPSVPAATAADSTGANANDGAGASDAGTPSDTQDHDKGVSPPPEDPATTETKSESPSPDNDPNGYDANGHGAANNTRRRSSRRRRGPGNSSVSPTRGWSDDRGQNVPFVSGPTNKPRDRGSYDPARSRNHGQGQGNSAASNGAGFKRHQFAAGTYKTEICTTHMRVGYCKYGENCQFAHGVNELRPRHFDVKYKTQMCKNYHNDGSCRFSSRCKFIHDEHRLQVSEEEFWLVSPAENLVRVEMVNSAARREQLLELVKNPPTPAPNADPYAEARKRAVVESARIAAAHRYATVYSPEALAVAAASTISPMPAGRGMPPLAVSPMHSGLASPAVPMQNVPFLHPPSPGYMLPPQFVDPRARAYPFYYSMPTGAVLPEAPQKQMEGADEQPQEGQLPQQAQQIQQLQMHLQLMQQQPVQLPPQMAQAQQSHQQSVPQPQQQAQGQQQSSQQLRHAQQPTQGAFIPAQAQYQYSQQQQSGYQARVPISPA